MKSGAPYIEQVRAEAPAAAEAIRRVVTSVETSFHKEHTVDDGHSTIRAKGNIYERERTVAMGDQVPVYFKPGDFTGSASQTWTVDSADVLNVSYALVGTLMIFSFYITTTAVGGTPALYLQIKIPDNFYAARYTLNACWMSDNGVQTSAFAFVAPAGRVVSIGRTDQANLTASAATTSVAGQLAFEVRTA